MVKEAREVLEWDILKFWSGMQDPRGGFYGCIGETGLADKDSSRGEQLNARILWSFSYAYRLLKKKEYLISAINAKEYFAEHFLDHKYGGVYDSVDSEGEKLDTDAYLSNHALAILALSEYYSATKDDDALKQVVNIYKIVERNFHDEKDGGYFEAADRSFAVKDESKVALSHLYLLEGYASLYRVWKDESLRNVIMSLLDLVETKFYADGHLTVKFAKDWSEPAEGCRYGVDLEASWSVFDAAYAIEDVDEVNKAMIVTDSLFKCGMEGLTEEGFVAYNDSDIEIEMRPWVQAEAFVACLCAWKYQGYPEAVDYAFGMWDYIKSHLNDTAVTSAFRTYPMHATRACGYVLKLFR